MFYNKLQKEATWATSPFFVYGFYVKFMQTSLYEKHFTWDRLQLNVFSMHNIKKKPQQKFMYITKEQQKRPPNKVCSFLYDYQKNVSQEIAKLRLFANNCSGRQNKNPTLSKLLMLLTDTARFE